MPGPPEGIALLWRDAALELLSSDAALYAQMDPRVAGLPAEVAGGDAGFKRNTRWRWRGHAQHSRALGRTGGFAAACA